MSTDTAPWGWRGICGSVAMCRPVPQWTCVYLEVSRGGQLDLRACILPPSPTQHESWVFCDCSESAFCQVLSSAFQE